MELRHLRYFVAVAEEGSLSNAAERRLHTAQPSLSRQIRDLELELGVTLLERRARGVELTRAGKVFLDHARLALLQVEAGRNAARRAEQPEKPGFAVGFLAGQEVDWLSDALRILRQESPDTEITLASRSSPELAEGLMQGKLDVALLRREPLATGLAYKFLVKEPLIVILPAAHRLAARAKIPARELAREPFINPSRMAPALKSVIDDYADKAGIILQRKYDAENISGGMSLVASTGGVTLLPIYVQNMLIPSVVARPLQGAPPTIDLVMGYSKSSMSPVLKKFLSRADELVTAVQQKNSRRVRAP